MAINRSNGTASQISTQVPGDGWLGSRYAVWDDRQSLTTTLYDLSTGKETDYWVKNCIRPAISDTQPYAVCLDFNHRAFKLVHVPDGRQLHFMRAKRTPAVAGRATVASSGRMSAGCSSITSISLGNNPAEARRLDRALSNCVQPRRT